MKPVLAPENKRETLHSTALGPLLITTSEINNMRILSLFPHTDAVNYTFACVCMCTRHAMHSFYLCMESFYSPSILLPPLHSIQSPCAEPEKAPRRRRRRASTYLLANYSQHFLFRCLQWQHHCLCWQVRFAACQGASSGMREAPDRVPVNPCVSCAEKDKNNLKEHKRGVSLPCRTKVTGRTRWLTETWHVRFTKTTHLDICIVRLTGLLDCQAARQEH